MVHITRNADEKEIREIPTATGIVAVVGRREISKSVNFGARKE
jgi:hypothetical protein